MLRSLAIPLATLRKALLVSVVLLVLIGGCAVWFGSMAALGLGMGMISAVMPALTLRWRHAAALTIPTALTGGVALALAGQAFPLAAFCALACLLVAPANALSNGLMAGIPTIAALFGALPVRADPASTAGWMVIGGLLVATLFARARRPSGPVGVPLELAWIHATVMAIAVALTEFAVVHFQIPHGYWAPLTMTVVLRPYGKETETRSRQRMIGTIGGAVLGLALALVLPGTASLIVAMALLVAVVAYALQGEYGLQVMFLTPFVLLLSAAGGSDVWEIAAERVLATLAAVLMAAALGVLLSRYDAGNEAAAGGEAAPGA